jgi:lauroyl/myristoyl acyltransferase
MSQTATDVDRLPQQAPTPSLPETTPSHNQSLSRSIHKRCRQWLVRTLFQAQLTGLRVLPWKPAIALGEGMGLIAFRFSSRYRGIAEKNLKIAYGDTLSGSERRHLIRRVFQNFARAMLIEWLKVPSLTPEQVRALVQVETLDPLTSALDRGKGVIVVSAHLGNWELLARRVAMEGFPVTVIARQSEDPAFNAITDRLRENAGYSVCSSSCAATASWRSSATRSPTTSSYRSSARPQARSPAPPCWP